MLISYDKNPNLTEEQRLQSLITSIQRALNELQDKIKELEKEGENDANYLCKD